MKPRVMLLCCAALAVLFVGNHEHPGKAAAQVPGEAPSFLTDYVDAVRVGDWFLACVEATAPEERFHSATRNTTAPWVCWTNGAMCWPKTCTGGQRTTPGLCKSGPSRALRRAWPWPCCAWIRDTA